MKRWATAPPPVDMAAVGDGQTSDEYHSTLCVKDSGGPYHHRMSTRLRQLAEQNNIPYKVDIYPTTDQTARPSGALAGMWPWR